MKKVAEKLLTNGVFLSVVYVSIAEMCLIYSYFFLGKYNKNFVIFRLPDKCEMNDVQLQNSKILKSVLNRDEYVRYSIVHLFMLCT